MSLLKLGSGGNGGTWGGGLVGSPIGLPAGTLAAPSLYWNGHTTSGFYEVSEGVLGYSYAGSNYTRLDNSGVRFRSDVGATWSSNTSHAAQDLYVTRYAAKQLMISGDGTGATTNAGVILGYGGSSNSAIYSSLVTPSGTTNSMLNGTATTTALNATNNVYITVSDTTKFTQTVTAGAGPSITAGTATTDVNALNITQTWNEGSTAFTAIELNVTNTASGASYLMDLQVGGTSKFSVDEAGLVVAASSIIAGDKVGISGASGNTKLHSPSTGVLTLLENDEDGFGRLQFGGTSSSFPAIKRNSATLDFRLADDSAYASIAALNVTVTGDLIGTAGARFYWTGRSLMASPSDGVITLSNNAQTAFSTLQYGPSATATSSVRLQKKVTGIADNTATAVATVTVPNANHAAAIKVTILSSNGSTDAFESSRVATGTVVVARTTGANAVAAVSTLEGAQIATVSGGATHTLAYGVSAISGAVGATNTFDIQVTIDDSGNLGSNQAVCVFELINAEATGVTIA